jgi:hypothetical protein
VAESQERVSPPMGVLGEVGVVAVVAVVSKGLGQGQGGCAFGVRRGKQRGSWRSWWAER